MIICPAIKIKYLDYYDDTQELVICGLRYADCCQVIKNLAAQMTLKRTNGFINHKGEFLDQKEALAHASEIGQLDQIHTDYNYLNELLLKDLS